MQGESLNIVQNLIDQLKQVVPQAFTENKLDIHTLKTLLGEDSTAEGERYGLSWAGKSESYKVLQTATTATLNPQMDKSIKWDETDNVLIEGENLEVLKILQKSYYGKIKMIYIDPPYNTGSDSFIYPDKFSETKEEYLRRIGEIGEEDKLLKEGLFRKNSKENGQYHSNWLNMMLPRLFLARNLLKEDGVIFVSIDDNEQANLKLLMDDIFGADNFVGNIIWRKKKQISSDTDGFANKFEYLVVYSKKLEWIPNKIEFSENYKKSFQSSEDEEAWQTVSITASKGHKGGGYKYTVKTPSGLNIEKTWLYPEKSYNELLEKGLIYFGKKGDSIPRRIMYLSDSDGQLPDDLWLDDGTNRDGKVELVSLFGEAVFDTVKPTKLIKKILNVSTDKGNSDIVLDFFAGSGSTAQAVLDLNEQDGGDRKFICVQLPEQVESNSEAKNAGFNTISDITQERIKRVVEKIENKRNGTLELKKHKPLGFRKYNLENSNFKIWRGDLVKNAEELLEQASLFNVAHRDGATTENMLWELLIRNGYLLTEKIQKTTLEVGGDIYTTQDKRLSLVLYLFTKETQEEILKIQPKTILILDSLFTGRDNDKTNAQLKFEDNGISFKSI